MPLLREDRSMVYEEKLARRVRDLTTGEPGLTEKRMFGGLAFLIGGNIAISASGQGGLMVRVDPANWEELIASSSARPLEMRGREMPGWVRVDTEHVGTKRQLAVWVERGVAFARTLPVKQ